MKTIKITLEKEGAQATCTHLYRETSHPEETTWAGNRAAFPGTTGEPISCFASLERLERVVSFQAKLCGATYKIEDLGGEATRWMDEVEF